MPQPEILIRKSLGPIDRRAPRAIPIQEIPALNHEIFNHAVEATVLVALRPPETVLRFACAVSPEVLRGAWHDVREEFHLYPTEGFAAKGDVEEDNGVGL